MNRFFRKLKTETINAIPAIIYFLIIFNLLHFTANIARQPGDTKYFSYLTMTIGALVVGKVIVIVNCFSFINAFPKKPIIYNIVWKLFVYNVAIILICIIHILLHLSIKLHSFQAALQKLMNDFMLPVFWETEMFLVLAFIAYIVFSELVRVIGKKQMKEIIFG